MKKELVVALMVLCSVLFADDNITISGSISSREVVKSNYPELPDWAKKLDVKGSVQLEVTVTPEGDIEDIAITKTCGYKELDLIMSDSVKKWKFEANSKPHEGKITITFDAKESSCSAILETNELGKDEKVKKERNKAKKPTPEEASKAIKILTASSKWTLLANQMKKNNVLYEEPFVVSIQENDCDVRYNYYAALMPSEKYQIKIIVNIADKSVSVFGLVGKVK